MYNNYKKVTLKNGVKLYMYIDKSMKKTYVEYLINYGTSGIYDKFYLNDKLYEVAPGCAHYLEHLLGEHSKYGNIYKYFTSKKYNRNGSTSPDFTKYYFVGVDDIYDSIEKLINTIDDPIFTKEDVEQTRPAIIVETKQGLNNKALLSNNIYRKNIYKNIDICGETLSFIGNEETTKKIDYDMLKACYDAYYYDDNKTLLICGNINEFEMIDFLENVYSKLKPHKKTMKEYNYDVINNTKKEEEIYYYKTNDDCTTIGFKEQSNNFSKKEIRYYLDFLCESKISNDGEFIKKLKKEKIISRFYNFNMNFFNDQFYDFSLYFEAKDTKKLKELLIKELQINNFSVKEFELFVKNFIGIEARKLDKKYNNFKMFAHRKKYTDNFMDLDFIKQLNYNRFIEFYNSLNFSECVVGIVRDTNKQ